MSNPKLLKAGLLCGLLAPVLWAAVIALCGALRPGFDHLSQYISELGERGSTTEQTMRYAAFVATGLMHIGFAGALYVLAGTPGGKRAAALAAALVAVNGLARIGAGVFVCEPGCAGPLVLSQRLHSLAAGIGFFAMIAATIVWGILFRRDPRLRPLSRYSIATGFASLMFLVLMSATEATRTGTGLYERLASGVLSLWVFLTAARLWWIVHGRVPDSS